jgi:hypothetical protein
VVFRDDLDTFCEYVAHRPLNVDRTVRQHPEKRHLEAGMRGVYFVARCEHRPDDGAAITVGLEQFCGPIDLADDVGTDLVAMRRIEAVEQRVLEAVAAAGGTARKGPIRYTGEAARSGKGAP